MISQQKKVLIVSYHFAPAGSTGGIRALKFVKYLREFGWESIVLTSKSGFDYNVSRDEGLLDQIPQEVQVFRTLSLEILNAYWLYRSRKGKDVSCAGKEKKGGKDEQEKKRSVVSFFKKMLIDLLSWPDRYAGWIPFAVFRGIYVILKEKAQVIFVTNPPQSSLFVGYLLSKITGRRLVIDYRDPWLIKSKWKMFIEKIFLSWAGKIICTSPQIYDNYVKLHPQIPADKFSVIYNGFDEQDFQIPQSTKEMTANKLTFVHAGYLYSNEGVEDFLKAVSAVVKESPEIKDKIFLLFIGARPQCVDFDILEKEGIARHVKRLPREECFHQIQNAHILMSFLPRIFAQAGCIPSKVFDAMLLKKPIISIMADGAAQNIIRETQIGKTITPGNNNRIKKAILEFYEKYQKGLLMADFDQAKVSVYSRKALTEKLVKIFDEIVF